MAAVNPVMEAHLNLRALGFKYLRDARPLRFIPPIVLGWHPFGPPEATRTRTRAG